LCLRDLLAGPDDRRLDFVFRELPHRAGEGVDLPGGTIIESAEA
jgi:hypothetical protein